MALGKLASLSGTIDVDYDLFANKLAHVLEEFVRDLRDADDRNPRTLVSETIPQEPQAASVRFFLTESEFKEAVVVRKSWANNRYYRIATRVISGFGAYFFIAVPSWMGETWSHLFRADPATAIGLLLFAILNGYVAIGMPGNAVCNRLINRFDQEREITLTHEGVGITRGSKLWKKRWKEFAGFYESTAMYVLQTHGTQFWSVPKRAFESGAEPVFRQILECRLRRM